MILSFHFFSCQILRLLHIAMWEFVIEKKKPKNNYAWFMDLACEIHFHLVNGVEVGL